ncbi:MAG: PEP-CTERM sorting domain-containing protein [Candidatus Acidiferrales bacterium]
MRGILTLLFFAILILSASPVAFASATGTSPVPEPASLFLLGVGLLGVGTVKRRLSDRKTRQP